MVRARDYGPLGSVSLANQFVRGFVASGLLAALQGRGGSGRAPARLVVRRAVQGGAALSAGVGAADALERREYGSAVLSATLGAAAIAAAEYLLSDKEHSDGEESEKSV